jgi:O-antigen ligase
MLCILLGSVFAASYAYGNTRDLWFWSAMLFLPLTALTRGPLAATAATLPLTFAPLGRLRRTVMVCATLAVGVVVFNSDRVQRKTFYGGSGDISDVMSGKFADTGRRFLWNTVLRGIPEHPWVGHSTGAAEDLVKRVTRGHLEYPHNDWLLQLYDYGIIGTAVYILTLIAVMRHALRSAARTSGPERLLYVASASAFIPFALIMLTDNVLVYVSTFGNVQMAMLGLAYASDHDRRVAAQRNRHGRPPTQRQGSMTAADGTTTRPTGATTQSAAMSADRSSGERATR